MKKIVLLIASLAILAFTVAAFAQHGEDHDCAAMMKQQEQQDAKLQSLVDTMNKATGQAKVDAMAAVITELVAQRNAMRGEMHEMMMHHMSGGQEHSMENCPMMKAKPSKKS